MVNRCGCFAIAGKVHSAFGKRDLQSIVLLRLRPGRAATEREPCWGSRFGADSHPDVLDVIRAAAKTLSLVAALRVTRGTRAPGRQNRKRTPTPGLIVLRWRNPFASPASTVWYIT